MSSSKLHDEHNSTIDFRIVAILIIISIGYFVFVQYAENTVYFNYVEFPLTALYGLSSLVAFFTAKRYWGSEIFGKAYLSLGIGFACVFIAELIWYYFEFTHQEPFPSVADIFYFALYPFTLYHLIKNCRYFKENWGSLTKLFLISFPILIVILYTIFFISVNGGLNEILSDEENSIWFFYTLIFVFGAANTTTFAILGILVFRQSTLASAWALLAGAIFVNDISDFWYYSEEIFIGWDPTHPTMALWLLSNLLVIYALLKHKKII